MKLIRFGEAGKEKPGVIINDAWFDVSEYISMIMMKSFLKMVACHCSKQLSTKKL